MADEQAVPPLPEKGEIVSTTALYNSNIANLRNMLAFSGTRNPTTIWSSMVRDDGSAMIYYREIEEKDDDVANALDTLKGNVTERPHSIKPFDESSQAAEVAAFVQQQFDGIPDFEGFLDNFLDAPAYGFTVQELIFDTSMGQASLVDIKDCPQELFLFGNRFQPQIGPLQFLDSPYASSGALVPESKFLTYTYRGRSRNRMGRPLLRSIFWSSWFKRNIQTLWMQYGEKGPGTVVVRYKDAAGDQEQQQAADLAEAIRSGAAIAVPEGFEYDKELLTVARSMDPAVYQNLFEAMQTAILRRVLGETLTSFGGDKGKGTQALGEVHSDTLEKKVVGICKTAASVINRQLIRPLVLWNFGPKAPMPRFAWETEQSEDLDKRINRDKTLQQMGVPMPLHYLQDTYEIPVPAAGDVVATPTPNAASTPAVPDAEDVTFSELSRHVRPQFMREIQALRKAGIPMPGAQALAEFMERRENEVAERELHQFDALFAQMKDESIGLLKERTAEIAASVEQ